MSRRFGHPAQASSVRLTSVRGISRTPSHPEQSSAVRWMSSDGIVCRSGHDAQSRVVIDASYAPVQMRHILFDPRSNEMVYVASIPSADKQKRCRPRRTPPKCLALRRSPSDRWGTGTSLGGCELKSSGPCFDRLFRLALVPFEDLCVAWLTEEGEIGVQMPFEVLR